MNFSRLRWRGASMERRGWRMAQGRNASTLNIFLHVHVSCQRTFIFGYQNAAHSIFRSISENVLVDALRQMKTKCVIWERTKHTQKLIQNAICLAQSRVCSSSGWFGHVTERSAGLSIRAPTHTHNHTNTRTYLQPFVICWPDLYRPRTCSIRDSSDGDDNDAAHGVGVGSAARHADRHRWVLVRVRWGESNTLLTHIFTHMSSSSRCGQLVQLAALNATPSMIRNVAMIFNQMTYPQQTAMPWNCQRITAYTICSDRRPRVWSSTTAVAVSEICFPCLQSH